MPHALTQWPSLTSAARNSFEAAAAQAGILKYQKYAELAPTHIFVPAVIETFRPRNMKGLDFIKELGRKTTLVTGDPRETTFLLQRLSIAVQCGNAVSCAGTFLPLECRG